MRMEDTICALSTPQGMGAIAMIRLSGPEAFKIFNQVFTPFRKDLSLKTAPGYSMLFGKITEGNKTVDEVMAGIFRNPHSYTGEDTIEISCHGSTYIQEQILKLLIAHGARLAEPGEYTMRAFANGKMDLSQAEAVADLIASESAASHRVALQQMRGGFSEEIKVLREELINFASLVELELDFAEEDVEFADRQQLQDLLEKIKKVLKRLIDSFATGNVIKNGVPVAIVGAPNAGKSTLLNTLLNEERAIVTEVAGTTRDAIEDEISLGGIKFRFIDTAGIRETEDVVESIGIRKTFEKIEQSQVVLYLFNVESLVTLSGVEGQDFSEVIKNEINQLKAKTQGKTLLIVANKMDLVDIHSVESSLANLDADLLRISALEKTGIEELIQCLTAEVNLEALNSNQT
ncbi:MAG TPA: tRNA uridine-5-carboxymethylaminomethyl(34) synthesis GTPase MnmE, partial [Cryomorphaceae bacterium]|nr:tRNA uridine-5-carboxymethylaminomethyl(34) synthesis GTPase MnmE [Cryomorphaceae bacterium]